MSHQDLSRRLTNISKVFSTEKILHRRTSDTTEIARYYKKNRLAYKLFNNRDGFVHMGISQTGTFSKDDFYEQARIVSRAIKLIGAKNILELAAGKATTIHFLARQNPKSNFYGIDLKNGQLKLKPKTSNVHLSYGDFHDLEQYSNESMDMVYVIEALCHATDKQKVAAEANRVLRQGGLFVVIDGYFTEALSGRSSDKKLASELVASSMMVGANNQSYDYFVKLLNDTGFSVQESLDYSHAILPSLYRLESKAKKLIEKPKLAKIMTAFAGDIVTANAIAGYLMPLCIKDNLFAYRYTLAKKIRDIQP